jgi:hypothetical protein
MWEYLTIALAMVGFVAAVVMLVVELPPVLTAAQRFARQHRQGH